MTEGDMENILKVDGNSENSNQMPLMRSFSNQHTGYHVFFSAVVESPACHWEYYSVFESVPTYKVVRLRKSW